MIRIEIDTAFNCRPRKGERRAPDGSGRLLKTSICRAECTKAAIAEVAAGKKAGAEIAPGYSEILAVRLYDDAAFAAWVADGGEQPQPLRTLTAEEIAAL